MRRKAAIATALTGALLLSGVALAANITCPNRAGNLCVGTSQADRMTGRTVPDDMRGRGGGDRLRARGSDDLLTGGRGGDVLRGAGGDDKYIFRASWGNDNITDGSGTDTLDFSAVAGGMLIDLVPSAGNEANAGASSTVDFPATSPIENVIGGAGADTMFGSAGSNALIGNGDGDEIEGRGGNDDLDGREGGDFYSFDEGWGNDGLTDVSGVETIDFSALSASSPVQAFMGAGGMAGSSASSGTDLVDFDANVIERFQGGAGDDEVFGNDLDNRFEGNAGDDEMYGGAQGPDPDADTLNGGTGDDTLGANSLGSDTLNGGPDNDSITGSGAPQTVDAGTGTDTVSTGGGSDTIDVADGEADDTANCGAGTDTVHVDVNSVGFPRDAYENCETIVSHQSG
jgi:Ca2+-binding RTX toxin-like protein